MFHRPRPWLRLPTGTAIALAATGLSLAVGCGDDPPGPGAGPSTAVVRHAFGAYDLAPNEEDSSLCVQWTFDNDEALYVQAATLSNDGFWHHSNWTIVPEDLFPGPDGYWNCRERSFDQVSAALNGTVLMAQSTQSVQEEQRFPEGTVIKIPPRHKVVAGIHFLNTTGRDVTTDMRMGLELIHPRDVQAILRPFHLDNRLLRVEPRSEARFRMTCDLADAFARGGLDELDLRIRYVLPHFHKRANFWQLRIAGGPRDGEVIHEVRGFNSDANGLAFDPPISLAGATGLEMECGYLNREGFPITYGIGENEMCEMLGLAESPRLIDATTRPHSNDDGEQLNFNRESVHPDGMPLFTADKCNAFAFPPNRSQDMPQGREMSRPLYVPPTDDPGVVVEPECVDVPAGASADGDATLAAISRDIFEASCAHNVCHGGPDPQQGLLLEADYEDPDDLAALRGRLLEHVVATEGIDVPLVAPGDAEGSYLWRAVSRCAPGADVGLTEDEAPHMPLLRPDLLDPALVVRIRDWIDAGAE